MCYLWLLFLLFFSFLTPILFAGCFWAFLVPFFISWAHRLSFRAFSSPSWPSNIICRPLNRIHIAYRRTLLFRWRRSSSKIIMQEDLGLGPLFLTSKRKKQNDGYPRRKHQIDTSLFFSCPIHDAWEQWWRTIRKAERPTLARRTMVGCLWRRMGGTTIWGLPLNPPKTRFDIKTHDLKSWPSYIWPWWGNSKRNNKGYQTKKHH